MSAPFLIFTKLARILWLFFFVKTGCVKTVKWHHWNSTKHTEHAVVGKVLSYFILSLFNEKSDVCFWLRGRETTRWWWSGLSQLRGREKKRCARSIQFWEPRWLGTVHTGRHDTLLAEERKRPETMLVALIYLESWSTFPHPLVFLKLVHTEYQVNHKTHQFWVKVVHLVPNVQTLAGHSVGAIRLVPTTTLNTVHETKKV